MLRTTREWASKAESDYDVVTLLLRSRKRSRFDPICFHCQQCAEKYLKARLTEASLKFPKTHDLATLLTLALTIEPSWSRFKPKLNALTQHGVLTCYPGADADAADARASVATCRAVPCRAVPCRETGRSTESRAQSLICFHTRALDGYWTKVQWRDPSRCAILAR